MSFLKSAWGSLVILIALMLVLEHYVGVSSILGSTTKLVTGTVGAFNTSSSSSS